jgi:hypothetical protein
MSKRVLSAGLDIVVAATILISGIIYYGNFYINGEKEFSFYQKYLYSAVNIRCVNDPDFRVYNSPASQELDERINLASISCDELATSPKIAGNSYYNGWHDTHPIFSTLVGLVWRAGDFTWEALWPIAGSLAGLAMLSFYVILRCFGLPWYAAALLFPMAIPSALLERYFFFLRDYSKVPFILLSFALLGILFRPGLSYRWRLLVLAASTCMIAIGMGFRQDSAVLMPTILAGAVFTSTLDNKRGILRFVGDVAIILLTFFLVGSAVDLLKTSQVAQLQGYPHFIVQGFADDFWKGARIQTAGVSFLSFYSDMIAWAAVDANSVEKVQYVGNFDPKYTTSGIDLIVKYLSLSAADVAMRVFSGLSVISQNYWVIRPVGAWLLLLLGLVALGRWRLGFFLMFTVLSLTAAGSVQFQSRHILHLIFLDRIVLIIVLTALLGGVWKYATSGLNLKWGLTFGTSAVGAVLVVAVIVGAHFVQVASLNRLKSGLDVLPWLPSQEAYSARFPNRLEAIERFTIDPSKCPAEKLEATIEAEGQKLSRPLDRLEGGPRQVYFAIFDPASVKVSVDVTPDACVTGRAWGPLGDGSIPPLQFFDPEVALQNQSIMQRLRQFVSSLL